MLNAVRSTSVFALLVLLALPVVFAERASATTTIGDLVWLDLDCDGIQDPDEPGVNGVRVLLYRHVNGSVELVCEYHTYSHSFYGDGFYIFNQWTCPEISEGDYHVEFVAPEGLVFSPQDQGDDDTVDSDADSSGKTGIITLSGPDDLLNLTIDAGLCEDGPPPPPPPPPGEECDGKVTELTLEYSGPAAIIRVTQQIKKDKDVPVFEALVPTGGQFTISGQDDKGTLGPNTFFYVGDELIAQIHTSCSRDIGPGTICHDLEVISGESKDGGVLSPPDDPSDACLGP